VTVIELRLTPPLDGLVRAITYQAGEQPQTSVEKILPGPVASLWVNLNCDAFRSLSDALGAALHLSVRGENTHHMIEACFKGVGRALRPALSREGHDLPSTKGLL